MLSYGLLGGNGLFAVKKMKKGFILCVCYNIDDILSEELSLKELASNFWTATSNFTVVSK